MMTPEERKAAAREYQRRYRAEHRDRINAQRAAWYEAHREELREKNRQYAKRNRAARTEYARQYRASHPDVCRRAYENQKKSGYARKYYLEHCDEMCAKNKRYREEHPLETKARQRWYYQNVVKPRAAGLEVTAKWNPDLLPGLVEELKKEMGDRR